MAGPKALLAEVLAEAAWKSGPKTVLAEVLPEAAWKFKSDVLRGDLRGSECVLAPQGSRGLVLLANLFGRSAERVAGAH